MSMLPEIRTRVAKHLLGDNRYFGRSTLHDLLGDATYTDLMALAVTGKACTVEERDLLDGLSVIMTSADPRIWPLKLTRLVSSYGGTLAGFAASQLPMEGDQIGPWIIGFAAETLVRFEATVREHGGDLTAAGRAFVAATPRIHGYGVPLRQSDERLDALTTKITAMGRNRFPYWELHEALAAAVYFAKGLRPNVGAGLAAMLLDMGYTPKQASAITTFQNQNVFAANAFEGARQQVDVLRTLPNDCVEYIGKSARTSPRAQEKVTVAILPRAYLDA